MFTLSNAFSLLRAPLALLFLINVPEMRACVVLAAGLTDYIDGYLARRYQFTTKFGAILDPLMDKFFVIFVLSILLYEARIATWEMGAMLARDASLLIFALYLVFRGAWRDVNYRSMLWGKVTTALQFAVLFFLSINIPISPYLFSVFFLFGLCMLIELFLTLKTNPKKV